MLFWLNSKTRGKTEDKKRKTEIKEEDKDKRRHTEISTVRQVI